MDRSFKSLGSFSPMLLPILARRSELPASAQQLTMAAVYFTYNCISKKPALVSIWQRRALPAAVHWPHAFWLQFAITVSLRAALQAESSQLSRKTRPVSLKTRDVSETANSEHTNVMFCNSQKDKQPVRVIRCETASWPESSMPLRQSVVLLPQKCCMQVRWLHFRWYTVELQRIKGVWWGSEVWNGICTGNLQWLGLSISEMRWLLFYRLVMEIYETLNGLWKKRKRDN